MFIKKFFMDILTFEVKTITEISNICLTNTISSDGTTRSSGLRSVLSITCSLTYRNRKDAGKVHGPVLCHVNNILLDSDFLV